jgi:protein pelota
MRILKVDKKTCLISLVPEIPDDLWHLERVIEKGDLVSGATDRKIKPKEQGEKSLRVKLFLEIEVEKLDFHRETGNLRVTGIIKSGKPADLIEMGSSHSIEIDLGKNIKIKKKELKKFQIERLEKASAATKKGKVLLVVLDDERADLALLKEFEMQKKGTIRSGKSGKRFESESKIGTYFKEIFDRAKELKAEKIVFAGPGFTKDSLKKWLDDKGEKGQFYFAATNSIGVTGLNELLKGSALDKITSEMQLVKETKLVENIFAEVGKNSGLVEYGVEQVLDAVNKGAVQQLLVADKTLLENRESVEELMDKTEKMGGEVHLVSAEHEAGEKLASIGGIAALLRFKLT